jgi:hypothetical protein
VIVNGAADRLEAEATRIEGLAEEIGKLQAVAVTLFAGGALVHDACVRGRRRHAEVPRVFDVVIGEAAPGRNPGQVAILLDEQDLPAGVAHNERAEVDPHHLVALGQVGDMEALLVGQLHRLHSVLLSLAPTPWRNFGASGRVKAASCAEFLAARG